MQPLLQLPAALDPVPEAFYRQRRDERVRPTGHDRIDGGIHRRGAKVAGQLEKVLVVLDQAVANEHAAHLVGDPARPHGVESDCCDRIGVDGSTTPNRLRKLRASIMRRPIPPPDASVAAYQGDLDSWFFAGLSPAAARSTPGIVLPAAPSSFLTSIRCTLSCASAGFGTVMVSTPCLNAAWI